MAHTAAIRRRMVAIYVHAAAKAMGAAWLPPALELADLTGIHLITGRARRSRPIPESERHCLRSAQAAVYVYSC